MESPQSTVVLLKNVSIWQQGRLVLKDIFLEIGAGEFVYLIGSTGSGKSSLLKLLYADLPLKKGLAQVAGFDLGELKFKKIPFLRRKLGIIFQEFELLTDRSVEENLHFVLRATGWKNKNEISERIEQVLLLVKLLHKRTFLPLQLSGGEQQRIAIARALLNSPKIILADEPTGNLDPKVANQIMELFIEINQTQKATVLIATHYHSFLKKHPARVLKCEEKKIQSISKEKVEQDLRITPK